MIRKEVLIVLVTFCLTATLFSIIPVGSQGVREYDPWYDINDDGKIDLKDYFGVGLKYGTYGTAINKTTLLLGIQNNVTVLQERTDSVKIVRFCNTTETMVNQTVPKNAATFVWVPKNTSNNAILNWYFYCQLKYQGSFVILVNGVECHVCGSFNQSQYEWYGVIHTLFAFKPNLSEYAFEFQMWGAEGNACYVKNINIVLEVMDGLPPS